MILSYSFILDAMRITHICLCGTYNQDWNYQDNLLARQNKIDGNDVLVVATCNVNDKESNRFYKSAAVFFYGLLRGRVRENT